MPFPANWTEELICEFLQLEGYFVESNRPVPVGKTGGRGEMDILGIKVEEDQLRIMHIETGIFNRVDLSAIKKKFGSATRDEIQSIADNLGFAENYLVKRWYVHAWGREKGRGKKWKQTEEELERDDIALMAFEEFLMKVIDAISQWKERHKAVTGWKPSLPKNLWLLKMLEALLLSGKLMVPQSIMKSIV